MKGHEYFVFEKGKMSDYVLLLEKNLHLSPYMFSAVLHVWHACKTAASKGARGLAEGLLMLRLCFAHDPALLWPEAPRARTDVRRASAPVIVRDALCAAKVLGQEVQLVHGRLEGQLVQTLLGRAGWLQRERPQTWRRDKVKKWKALYWIVLMPVLQLLQHR